MQCTLNLYPATEYNVDGYSWRCTVNSNHRAPVRYMYVCLFVFSKMHHAIPDKLTFIMNLLDGRY